MDLTPIINGIAVGIVVPTLLYIARLLHKILKQIQKHEKALFGDEDIKEWEGIVKIGLTTRKYSINDRRAFIHLISILCRNNTITLDDELKEAIEILKKDEA